MSAEEDDFVFPLEVMRTGARGRAPPAPAVFDATLHGCLAPQGEDDPFNLAAQTAAPRDARGSYDRTGGKGTRSKWLPHVQSHMKVVKTGNLSAYLADPKRACSKNCPQGGKCLEAVGTIRVLKGCAAESFGEAALEEKWDQIRGNHAAVATWFMLAHSGRIVDGAGKVIDVLYKVGSQLVCAPVWGAMRGMPPSTVASIDRAVLAGEMMWNDGSARAVSSAARTLTAPLKTAATQWWMTRLGYYEMVTKRGLILHPRDMIWKAVYAEEFVPEMRLLGHPWKLPDMCDECEGADEESNDDECGSRRTWYDGRAAALKHLAVQKLGPESKAFEFKSRAKHSAYKECADCQEKRLAKRAAIRRGAAPDEIKRLDLDLTDHLQWMYKQRLKLEQITQMAGHEVRGLG